jgi:hypothetical protein
LAGIGPALKQQNMRVVSYICGVSRRSSTLRDSIFTTTTHHGVRYGIGQACGASLVGGSFTHSEESGLGAAVPVPARFAELPAQLRFRLEGECLVTVWNRRKSPPKLHTGHAVPRYLESLTSTSFRDTYLFAILLLSTTNHPYLGH